MEDINAKKEKETCGVYGVLLLVKKKGIVLSIVFRLKYELGLSFFFLAVLRFEVWFLSAAI